MVTFLIRHALKVVSHHVVTKHGAPNLLCHKRVKQRLEEHIEQAVKHATAPVAALLLEPPPVAIIIKLTNTDVVTENKS